MLLLTASLFAAEPQSCEVCGVYTSTSGTVTMVVLPDGQGALYDLILGEQPRMEASELINWRLEGDSFHLDAEVYARKGKVLTNTTGPGGWEKIRELPGQPEVEAWAKAWQERDHAAYSAFYGESFQAKGMDRTAYLDDKKGKFDKATCIEVGIEDVQNQGLTTTFEQTYVSNTWCDAGTKTLTWALGLNGWELTGEEQPTSQRCEARCTPR